MERQIVFRGKRKDNGKWIHGDLQLGDGDHIPMIGEVVCGHDPYYVQVEEDTIGQFTGLYDKNGSPIYEGDIVKTPLLDPIFGDILSDAFDNAPIEFSNGSFVVSYYNGNHKIYIQDLYDKIEVIGNIHDPDCPCQKKGGEE